MSPQKSQKVNKILVTTGIFPPDIGGPATYSDILFRELTSNGYLVKVLTYGSYAQKKEGVLIISNNWPKGLRHFFYFLKILILGFNSDLIIAADSSFGAGFISVVATKLIRKKIIIRVTGDYAWEQGWQRYGIRDLMDDFQFKRHSFFIELLKKCQRFSVKKADFVITPSNYLKKTVMIWGAPEGKVIVIHNAIKIPDLKLNKEEARQKLNLNGKILISAGRLVVWKGFDLLIKSVSDLKGEFPNLKLIIVGDGPWLNDLKRLVNNLGIGDRVIFTGLLSKMELVKYLIAADVFALNTAYEGFSHQIIETMILGLPVVTTDICGNPEIIRNGKNGFLLKYNDIKSFKEIIKELFSDENLCHKIGEAAKGSISNFSNQSMFIKLKELINSL